MQKLLRQKTSGHIYVWTKYLAERPDMEEVTQDVAEPVQEPVQEQPSAAKESAAETEVQKMAKGLLKRKRSGGMQDDVGATDELSIKLN
jgi:hypothetical protein